MKPFRPVRTAVIGCGMISDVYLSNLTKRYNAVEVVGVSDIKPERSGFMSETPTTSTALYRLVKLERYTSEIIPHPITAVRTGRKGFILNISSLSI